MLLFWVLFVDVLDCAVVVFLSLVVGFLVDFWELRCLLVVLCFVLRGLDWWLRVFGELIFDVRVCNMPFWFSGGLFGLNLW